MPRGTRRLTVEGPHMRVRRRNMYKNGWVSKKFDICPKVVGVPSPVCRPLLEYILVGGQQLSKARPASGRGVEGNNTTSLTPGHQPPLPHPPPPPPNHTLPDDPVSPAQSRPFRSGRTEVHFPAFLSELRCRLGTEMELPSGVLLCRAGWVWHRATVYPPPPGGQVHHAWIDPAWGLRPSRTLDYRHQLAATGTDTPDATAWHSHVNTRLLPC